MYKVLKLKQEDIPNYIPFGIEAAPCVLYGIHDKPFCWICNEEKCDFDYIKEHNIPYIKIDGNGSTIVCSEGDINFGFFGTEDFCNEQFKKLSNLVSKKTTDSKFLNNDFMYNDNKHGGATHIDFGDVYYIGVHISNNIDKDLIERICKKKCYKTPEKLSNPITEEDVLKLYEV